MISALTTRELSGTNLLDEVWSSLTKSSKGGGSTKSVEKGQFSTDMHKNTDQTNKRSWLPEVVY